MMKTIYVFACWFVAALVFFRLGYLVRVIGWRGIARELTRR